MFISVSEVAEKVIWNCVVEDPNLFLRHFLEKMTHKDKHVSKSHRGPLLVFQTLFGEKVIETTFM